MLGAVFAIPDAASNDLSKLGDSQTYIETHARDLPMPSVTIIPERKGDLRDSTSTISDDVRCWVSSFLFK
jgi:hypothetical protein